PEEINRIMTDSISDLLFTHSPEAAVNLAAEGRPTDAIHPVGNTMIDTLETLKSGFDPSATLSRLQLAPGSYLMVTLHRPALVDGPLLQTAVEALNNVARFMPVVFPVHPRTAARIESLPVKPTAGLHLTEPLGYLEFMGLVQQSAAVLTDSGGVQEETTVLGVPCFTLRSNTERPITVSEGTNMLLGLEPQRIRDLPDLIAEVSRSSTAKIPSGWDGLASERLVDVLESSIVPRSR
ncbi:MAG: UDP-N-acetylglucosamine 2-epimerase, partial [Actinomycetes bacterium]